MASAFSLDDDDVDEFRSRRRNSGDKFHMGVFKSPHEPIIIQDLVNIAKTCFDFDLKLYGGIDPNDTFFLVSDSDFVKFKNALPVFGEGEKFVLIPTISKINEYKVNLPENERAIFAKHVGNFCGAQVENNNTILKCCEYQLRLIRYQLAKIGLNIDNFLMDLNGHDSMLDFLGDPELLVSNFRTPNDDRFAGIVDLDARSQFQDVEDISNLNLFNKDTANYTPIYVGPERFVGNKSFEHIHKVVANSRTEIILIQKVLTQIQVDSIVNAYKLDGFNFLINVLNEKCGDAFENQFKQQIDKIEENFPIFQTNPGKLRTCKSITTVISPYTWFGEDLLDGFKNLYGKYIELFEYAIEARMRTLALIPFGLDEEYEICLYALVQALNDVFIEDTCIQKVYICSIKDDCLIHLKDFLQNGYDQSIFHPDVNDNAKENNAKKSNSKINERRPPQAASALVDNQSYGYDDSPRLATIHNSKFQEVQRQPKNNTQIHKSLFAKNEMQKSDLTNGLSNMKMEEKQKENTPKGSLFYASNKSIQPQAKDAEKPNMGDSNNTKLKETKTSCFNCKSNDYANFLSQYLSGSCLRNCAKHQIGKCETCLILYDLAQILAQHQQRLMSETIDTFCFKCSINHIVMSKKVICSSCLRRLDPKNSPSQNKVCSTHSICQKCVGISNKTFLQCYYCNFIRFVIVLNEMEGKSLVANHMKLNCCYDYCDLKRRNSDEIIKLKCGHRACFLIKQQGNVCGFCSIKKLLKEYKIMFRIQTNEYVRTINEKPIDTTNDGEYNELITDDEDEDKEEEDEQDDVNEEKEASRENEDDDKDVVDKVKIESNQEPAFEAKREVEKANDFNLLGNFESAIIEKKVLDECLPGYEDETTIELRFYIPDGIQSEIHPNPGEQYYGLFEKAYLPNNQLGCHLSRLIIQCFESGTIVKLVKCESNVNAFKVELDDIQLKTAKTGGPEMNGYPDEEYLMKLKDQLELKFDKL